MTRKHGEFVDFVVESLAPLGGVGARRMFGGHGIFKDGLMFALIADDRLYLKVDDLDRPAYEAAGLDRFTYVMGGRTRTMSYHEAPPESLDDAEVLCEWSGKAFAAALRAKRARR